MSEAESTPKKQKSRKRDLIEWGLIIVIAITLYTTGYHTEVIGTIQRGLLLTGIIRPDTTPEAEDIREASFNFPLITIDGEQTSLKEFEGKTIFLNLWATWCPPCIAEMPNIQDLYDDLKDNDDVVFVMLSLDEDPDVAKAFLERKEFTLPVYFRAGRQPGVYNSTVVPTTYIISPEGNIVSEKRGMAKYNTSSFKEFLTGL